METVELATGSKLSVTMFAFRMLQCSVEETTMLPVALPPKSPKSFMKRLRSTWRITLTAGLLFTAGCDFVSTTTSSTTANAKPPTIAPAPVETAKTDGSATATLQSSPGARARIHDGEQKDDFEATAQADATEAQKEASGPVQKQADGAKKPAVAAKNPFVHRLETPPNFSKDCALDQHTGPDPKTRPQR